MSIVRILSAAGLLLSLLLHACVPASREGSATDPNRLSRQEIAAVDASDLYEVVQRLRPRWLSTRGERSFGGTETGVLVYQGQTRLGGVEALRQIPPGTAYALEYMDGVTASNALPGIGSRHVTGAIIIHTSPGLREP